MSEAILSFLLGLVSRLGGRITTANAPIIADGVSRSTARAVSAFLPREAKDTFNRDVLNHLLEATWDDHAAGKSGGSIIARSLLRSADVFWNARSLRSGCRAISESSTRASWAAGGRWVLACVTFPLMYWGFRRQQWKRSRWELFDDLVVMVPYVIASRMAPVPFLGPATMVVGPVLVGGICIPYLVGVLAPSIRLVRRSMRSLRRARVTLVHVGQSNYIAAARIVEVSVPRSLPMRNRIRAARSAGTLVDLTAGRRSRAAVFMDDGSLVLAAVTPETVAARISPALKPQ